MSRFTSATIALAVTLAVTLANGCGTDDDPANDSASADTTAITDPTDTAANDPTTDGATTIEDTADASTSEAVDVGRLELSASPPAEADVVIEADGPSDDRSIRRGGQAALERGQTFPLDGPASLTGVSFLVAAETPVPAGQVLELALFEVANTDTMVPSAPIAIGDGTERLGLALPEAIDEPVHVVFTLPAVELTPGQYAVALAIADGGPPAELLLQHAAGDALPDGVPITLDGGGWQADTGSGDAAISLTFAV